MICLIARVKKFKLCRLSASSAFLPITYFWFLTSALSGWFSHHIAARLFLTTSSQRSVPTDGLESNSCLCPGTLRHACVHLHADQSLLFGSHVHGRQISFSSGSGSAQLLHQICGMVPQSKPAFLVSGISSFILQLQFFFFFFFFNTGRRPGSALAPTVRERAAGRDGEGAGREGRLGAGPGVTSLERLQQLQFKSRSAKLKFSLAIGPKEWFSINKTFRKFSDSLS